MKRLEARLALWAVIALGLVPSGPVGAANTATSRDGRVHATVTDQGVFVQQGHERPRALFLIAQPAALAAPLKRLRRGDPLWNFADGYDPDLAKDPRQWALGDPALTPDGRAVYFFTNLGQGMGEQGNTTFLLARGDVATGRVALVLQAGAFFGRPPDVFALSPDAHHLLIALSVHDTAADNSSSVQVLNLRSWRATDLLAHGSPPGRRANHVDGAVWSHDGRRVSVLIAWYDPRKLADDTLPAGRWEVKDARTGRTLSVRPQRDSLAR